MENNLLYEIGLIIEAFVMALQGKGRICRTEELIVNWKKFGKGAYTMSVQNGAQRASRLLLKKRILSDKQALTEVNDVE